MDQAIKLCFAGKIKRVPMQSSYLTLFKTICDAFLINSSAFSMHYLDDEGDEILIENESDYHMALKFSQLSNTILKIYIKFPEDSMEYGKKFNTLVEKEEIEDCSAPEEQTLQFFQCNSCQRTFSSTRSYSSHTKVCEKLFKLKSDKFDVNKMRLKGIANTNGVNLMTLLNLGNEGIPVEKKEKCPICSRAFGPSCYNKHVINCRKKVKRVPFDSSQQRLTTEQKYLSQKFIEFLQKKDQTKNENKKQWHRQSERFRKIVKIARKMMTEE